MKPSLSRHLVLLGRHLRLWQQVIHDRSLLEMARNRALVTGMVFSLVFITICGRLVDVMVFSNSEKVSISQKVKSSVPFSRANIVDRNGELLATHLITASVYANPRVIIDAKEAAIKLTSLMPDLDYQSLLQKLQSNRAFIWIKRHIPPKLQQEINQLGIPGIYLQRDEKRVYPHGSLVSHVLGHTDIDNHGLAGIEKSFDQQLSTQLEPVTLSIDVRIQYIVHDELMQAISQFNAEGGNAIIMDVETGEVLAMISLPDYDSNLPLNRAAKDAGFNKNTLGIYEPGSVLKIFTTAIALDKKTATLNSRYDATMPIRVGRFNIKDFQGKNRILDVKEGFLYSSNIVNLKMALEFGKETQKQYLKNLGLFDKPSIEIPEIGTPMIPQNWHDSTTMTVSYGYGIAISPLQLINAVAAIINDGKMHSATLIKQDRQVMIKNNKVMKPVISKKTSQLMRYLMGLTVLEGNARKAAVQGYSVIAKTGTAQKKVGSGYMGNARRSSIVGAFPQDRPRYMFLITLDNPQPVKGTYGFATGGWNAAPTASKIIARMAPLLGIQPTETPTEDKGLILAAHRSDNNVTD